MVKKESKEIVKQILELVSDFSDLEFGIDESFFPGITPVPVSGKLIGKEEITKAVESCLDGWFTTGRFAKEFSKRFAKYMHQRHCILTNSGSSANLLALSALTSPNLGDKRLKPGDEVITVAAGFPTTVNPILQNGLKPVFVDVNIENYGIDVNQMEASWSPKVKAIMIAHTLGNPFDLEAVKRFADSKNLWLIEDCCDAVGSTYNEKMVGTFGDLATVSFYPAHHITMGEGGAVLTRSPKLKKIVESFRDWGRDCWCDPGIDNTCGKRFEWSLGNLPHGFDHKYTYSHLGYNLKLTDMQAAIGLAQIDKLDDFINQRKKNFKYLHKNLLSLEKYLDLPKPQKNSDPSWFGFPMRVKPESPLNRNEIVKNLTDFNIGTRLLFAGNLVKQPYFKDIDYRSDFELINTDIIMEDVFWIGLQPNLNKHQLEYVCESLRNLVQWKE